MKWLLLSALIASPLWAADGPTPAQIAACRDDAFRFCLAHIGDPPAMRACMVRNKERVSQLCKEAFK